MAIERLTRGHGVDAVVVVVVALATLMVTSFVTTYETKACEDEYRAVQASLVAYMAHNHMNTVPASIGTSDLTTPVLLYDGDATNADPSFARDQQTRWMYAWDGTGRITRISAKPGGPYLLPVCTVSSP